MHIFYQGEKGAYSHIVASWAAQKLQIPESQVFGAENFSDVWKAIADGNIGILPIENSYAGSIHENFYGFLRHPFVVRAEYLLPVEHCLLSHENDLSQITVAYSHPQALAQCHNFLQKHSITPKVHSDTAGAAKDLSISREKGAASISCEKAAEIYSLRVLQKGIQDQKGNTTRFFVVTRREIGTEWGTYFPTAKKTSLIFETKNIPAALYHCLGVFARHEVNLTKIESLPSLNDPFSYAFWVDIEGTWDENPVSLALAELAKLTKTLRIIGSF